MPTVRDDGSVLVSRKSRASRGVGRIAALVAAAAVGVTVAGLIVLGPRFITALGAIITALATLISALNGRGSRVVSGWPKVRAWLSLRPGMRPHCLPGAPEQFTGRGKELGQIRALAGRLLRSGQGTEIVVLWGMGGMGKSTLAAVIAREYREDFEHCGVWDFLDHPGGRQRGTSEALAHLLQSVASMSAEQLPEDQSEEQRDIQRELLWRKWASTRSTLLVLENVSTFAQVDSLIPADGKHLILITSRYNDFGHLPSLRYEPILLDGLAEADALLLFERVAGRELDGGERRHATDLIRRTGGLPLAICLLAATLRDRTSTVAQLLAEFGACGGALAVVDERCRGREKLSAAADLAFGRLSEAAKRVFCLLGQHPLSSGIDISAAQALTGAPRLESDLRSLCNASLLHPVGQDGARLRYKMHGLVREYARSGVPGPRAGISAAEVSEAIERLFGYYWRTARDWATPAEPCLTRHTRPGANPVAAPAISVGRAPMPPESQQRVVALGWFEEHRELLLACIDHARDHHLDQWVVRLTSVMAGFLRNNGPWDQAIDRHADAADAAGRLLDDVERAVALNDLGIMCRLAGRLGAARAALSGAYAIFAGNLPATIPERDVWLGQANALNEQGIVLNERGDHAAAAQALEPALGLYRKAGDLIGVANASKNLGVALYHAGLGRHDENLRSQALLLLDDAMGGYAAIGDVLGQVEVSNHRGLLCLQSGDTGHAFADFRRALDTVRLTGNRLEAARALEGTGRCHQARGDSAHARQHLQDALRAYADIRAEAARRAVAAELKKLRPGPG